MKLSSCGSCGKELSDGVIHCPYCPSGIRTVILVRDLIVVLCILGLCLVGIGKFFGGW